MERILKSLLDERSVLKLLKKIEESKKDENKEHIYIKKKISTKNKKIFYN